MTRLRGRCPRGKRLVAKVPHGHWKMTTFVAGLRQDGMTAPFVVDAPMNAKSSSPISNNVWCLPSRPARS